MDTALPQKFPFILDRNLAKANCTGNRVCTSCDTVVLDTNIFLNERFVYGSHTHQQLTSQLKLYTKTLDGQLGSTIYYYIKFYYSMN